MEQISEQILTEVKKVIVGKDDKLAKIWMAILSSGHVLLDDVPGTGKTTTAIAFGHVLGLEYKRIQFTPDVLPSDIVGFSIYDKNTGTFSYKQGAVMTNLLLADEINRTSSKTQSALLEVMEERQATVDGVTHILPAPFVVMATQNPIGSAGTQLLPQAQLDRFMIRLELGYPDFFSQVELMRNRQQEDPINSIRQVVTAEDILKMQEAVQGITIVDELLEYITHLAEESRRHPMITLGISPRGAIAVCRMSKACAYIQGRDYVLPEDIQQVFIDVCTHRVVMAPKAKITEVTAQEVLREIMETVQRPDHI